MLKDVIIFLTGATLILCVSHVSGESQSARDTIVLVPIGAIDAQLTSWLQEKLPGILSLKVTTASALGIPTKAYRAERSQYQGDEILSELQSKLHQAIPEQRFVGLIDADCYAPGLNFIFGQAMPGGPMAFVALPRLRQSFYGKSENEELFRERVLKEVVHELGHTWNLPHCPNEKCVMHFSNSLADTDYKSDNFCAICRKQLATDNH